MKTTREIIRAVLSIARAATYAGLFIAAAAAFLVGCASAQPSPGVNQMLGQPPTQAPEAADEGPLDRLRAIVRTDLQTALAMAEASGDIVASSCWKALLAIREEMEAAPARPQLKGAISAFQAVRGLSRSSQGSGLMTKLRLGCSALKDEEQAKVGKFAIKALPGGGALTDVLDILGK